MDFRKLGLSALTIALVSSTTFGAAANAVAKAGQQLINFDQAGTEATRYLVDYLKIDTSNGPGINPTGNEKAGADFLAAILKANGIEATVYESAPNRGCVYARLKGNGKKKAVILLSHIDVVPAKGENWLHGPFSGEIHDNELWGRGSLDMKGMGIAELETMLLLKRSGRTLDRDVIFLGTADEEQGGAMGAKWFVDHHPELVKDAEYLLTEGFYIDSADDGKARYWGIDVAEKNLLWLKLTAKGTAGHASMPIANSAPNRLARALQRLVDSPAKPLVLPEVRDYFKSISVAEKGQLKAAFADIDAAVKNPETLKTVQKDSMKAAMLQNTFSLTIIKAGYKTNVIPTEATAELDCRLLPTVNPDDFVNEIKGIINDPQIEVTKLDWIKAEPSPFNTECIETIKAIAAKEAPGVPVVPVIIPWFTDSHWFRDLGITSYGFLPFQINQKGIATVHGINERIPLDEFKNGIRRLYLMVEKLCSSK